MADGTRCLLPFTFYLLPFTLRPPSSVALSSVPDQLQLEGLAGAFVEREARRAGPRVVEPFRVVPLAGRT